MIHQVKIMPRYRQIESDNTARNLSVSQSKLFLENRSARRVWVGKPDGSIGAGVAQSV
jgi:hypothetical protein